MSRNHVDLCKVLDIKNLPLPTNHVGGLLLYNSHLIEAIYTRRISANTNGPQVIEVFDGSSIQSWVTFNIFKRLLPFFVPTGIIQHYGLGLNFNTGFGYRLFYIYPRNITCGIFMRKIKPDTWCHKPLQRKLIDGPGLGFIYNMVDSIYMSV